MWPGPSSSKTPVRVVIATTTFLSSVSLGRGAALALVELGGAAFFASGVAERAIGPSAPWFVLAAVLVGVGLRAVDLEGCALFVPGGLWGTVKEGLGRPAARLTAAGLLVEHLLLGALSASVFGHYFAAVATMALGVSRIRTNLAAADLATLAAVGLLGAVWWWQREDRPLWNDALTRIVTAVVALLAGVVCWALIGVIVRDGFRGVLPPLPSDAGLQRVLVDSALGLPPIVRFPLELLTALGYCLFAIGGSDALAHVAPELQQPRILNLRRIARLLSFYALFVTAGAAFAAAALVPADVRAVWFDAALVALPAALPGPVWVKVLVALACVGAIAVLLAGAVLRAALSVQSVLSRLSDEGLLAGTLRSTHRHTGGQSRVIDLVAIAQLTIIEMSAGQVSWLARMYAVGLVCVAFLKIATLIRFRSLRPEPRAFRVPLNVPRVRGEWPVGLLLLASTITVPTVLTIAGGDAASIAGALMIVGFAGLLTASARWVASREPSADDAVDDFQLMPSADLGLDHVEVRPGNLLVAIRRPHFLAHLSAALQAAGDRDVVVMTVRVVGDEVGGDPDRHSDATGAERRLFTAAVEIAERYGRAVRLLIVPATNVFDAVAQTVVRLRSSEVYTGESETLSADDQARLLGEAWERVPKTEPLDVRLIIHHSSGRTAAYALGAHAPALTVEDLNLIHSLWLDAVKTIGPHVHHRDIVRAALTHMEQQLQSPNRDAVVDLVRQVARPADELAAVVRDRDFARLRDMVRNRTPSDLAWLLTDLSIEDQVIVFRVLPRNVAASTFEYLSQEAQEVLLKAMAQEDVASLLNNMAPDDRTMFLEELPASVTQHLLALLTPDERAVALTLLGYPEGSIGRLMTPDYIAVREHWTVQEVLDYIRVHGQDSETLNVIYVVDDHGVLIDDIRIRDFLLTALTNKVSDLMDRRFVALKAGEAQGAAVSVFRREDRSALPVTDSAGVLIGIVTIDDVLDVAEAAATKEIQRIGGSEALDEPYMRISFPRMIQKRAGWLTALFLGEMLTATAMGFFEQEIARAVVLALFVPLIISSGGNSGSQASTLVIRAIALGEVQLQDWWRVMRREIAAGLALGGILGTIGFLRITVWSAFSTLYGPHWLLVAVTVGMALVGVVLWGTLIGSLLPFLLRRLGFDPATSSAPFVATLVDVTGLVIYFSVGLLMLRGTVL
jgi:magnesium transporter